MNSQVSTPRCK